MTVETLNRLLVGAMQFAVITFAFDAIRNMSEIALPLYFWVFL